MKLSIKRKNMKLKKPVSTEQQVQLRIQRKLPSERRKQALKNFFHIIIEMPVRFICKLTIPTAEEEKWHRNFAACNPPFCYLLVLVATESKCQKFLRKARF